MITQRAIIVLFSKIIGAIDIIARVLAIIVRVGHRHEHVRQRVTATMASSSSVIMALSEKLQKIHNIDLCMITEEMVPLSLRLLQDFLRTCDLHHHFFID